MAAKREWFRTTAELKEDVSDSLADEEQELEALVESLDKTCRRYKMEINAENTKLMTNCANDIQKEIKAKRRRLGTVISTNALKQLFQMKAQKRRFFRELHKPLQL